MLMKLTQIVPPSPTDKELLLQSTKNEDNNPVNCSSDVIHWPYFEKPLIVINYIIRQEWSN